MSDDLAVVDTTSIPLEEVSGICTFGRPDGSTAMAAIGDATSILDAATWSGFFLPTNTPSAIVQKLTSAASAVVDTPAVQARLREIGATVVAPERRSPAYLQAFIESEIKKWAEPIKAANLTVN